MDFSDNDSAYEESQGQTQTQTQTQTEDYSQDIDHLWGYLQPVHPNIKRIEFWKTQTEYMFGRHPECHVIFTDNRISQKHCLIKWVAGEGPNQDCVVLTDMSTNGTYVNGRKIGRDKTSVLRDGNEVALASLSARNQAHEDYRYFFRHVAYGQPTDGIYSKYDIIHELGKGSFATVMKAVERATGAIWAVKKIRDPRRTPQNGSEGGGNGMLSIEREVGIMKTLKHGNVCELHEAFIDPERGGFDLVLDFIDGGDLLEYIVRANGIDEENARHITFQLCEALKYIHSKGVTHRDLKPENVLLTRHDPPIVKVADFGLAKVADSFTMLRTVCGTPTYLAPEVILGGGGYHSIVDSWSVGVIVFSMLTACLPFNEDGESTMDIQTRIRQRQVQWELLRERHISSDAQDFIAQLLKNEPLDRLPLSKAASHPWLQAYSPIYTFDEKRQPVLINYKPHPGVHAMYIKSSQEAAPLIVEASMASASADASQEMQKLNIRQGQSVSQDSLFPPSDKSSQPDPVTPPLATRPLSPQGSKLQRRAIILSQVEEGQSDLQDPPEWMVENERRARSGATKKHGRESQEEEQEAAQEDAEDDIDENAMVTSPKKKAKGRGGNPGGAPRQPRAKVPKTAEPTRRSGRLRS